MVRSIWHLDSTCDVIWAVFCDLAMFENHIVGELGYKLKCLFVCMCFCPLGVIFYWRQIGTSSQRHVTRYMWHVTYDMWYVICEIWCDMCGRMSNFFFYNNDKCKCKILASEVGDISNYSDDIFIFLVPWLFLFTLREKIITNT